MLLFFLSLNFCHETLKVDDKALVLTGTDLLFIVKCLSFEDKLSSVDLNLKNIQISKREQLKNQKCQKKSQEK